MMEVKTNYVSACVIALKKLHPTYELVEKGYKQMVELEKQLDQLEANAELGRAVRKAFEQGYSVMRDDGDFEETFDNDMVYVYDLNTIANNEQDLLKWAEHNDH